MLLYWKYSQYSACEIKGRIKNSKNKLYNYEKSVMYKWNTFLLDTWTNGSAGEYECDYQLEFSKQNDTIWQYHNLDWMYVVVFVFSQTQSKKIIKWIDWDCPELTSNMLIHKHGFCFEIMQHDFKTIQLLFISFHIQNSGCVVLLTLSFRFAIKVESPGIYKFTPFNLRLSLWSFPLYTFGWQPVECQ